MAEKFKIIPGRSREPITTSPALGKILMSFGQKVLASAKTDPNPRYRESLHVRSEITTPKNKSKNPARVRVIVGVHKSSERLGLNIEAKRGTLAKAVGEL